MLYMLYGFEFPDFMALYKLVINCNFNFTVSQLNWRQILDRFYSNSTSCIRMPLSP